MQTKLKILLILTVLGQLGFASPCSAVTITRPNWPDLVKWVDPEYPPALWHHGIYGRGVFRLTIDPKTGEVTEVKVLKSTGYKILNELAAKAFLQCQFKPGGRTQLVTAYEFGSHGFSRDLH